ncbi:hypothetical protein BDN70DRAFT_885760 [Pholiota conissans]|uniref:Rho-GAP domain-containing protein n=1 Tax=Pholiota conissans TaxID=109636 RepID=A0A9P5YPG8_9AGAR|nr:hypothetical protein BDN70DRAFT_885760 [Pholiota conissans]
MPTSHKLSSPSHLPPDPSPRNPRIHRQSGIPSINRPRLSSNASFGAGTLNKLKKTAHHLLSNSPDIHVSDQTPARRRFASMPHPYPATPGHIETTPGLRSRNASASPPIVDFTAFADTYRGPRTGHYEGLMPRHSRASGARNASDSLVKPSGRRPLTPSSTVKPIPATGVPLPASARKPDVRLVFSSLEDVFGGTRKVDEYLDAHELLCAHQLDQVDLEDRERVRVSLINGGKLEVPGQKGALAVLGEPIRKASIYASMSMVLAGREHELPIIVVNTVEELYRTGIYQSNLFRTLPNRSRLLELIDIYDSPTQPQGSVIRSRRPSSAVVSASNQPSSASFGFGAHTSLHLESTPDVCALLTTYLSSLPEPILPPMLFSALWEWCGLDEEDAYSDSGTGITKAMLRQDSFGPRVSHIPLARTYTSPEESTRIIAAQLVLHLMPSANFSLLVYLLAFFSQAALVQEENGVGVGDLARMFGGKIFGGDSVASSSSSSSVALDGHLPTRRGGGGDVGEYDATQTKRTGETMMAWFLRRWGPLSETLFDVLDDARMGIFRRVLVRRDSFGRDVLGQPYGGASSGEEDATPRDSEGSGTESGSGDGEGYLTPQPKSRGVNEKAWIRNNGGGGGESIDEKTPVPRIHLDGVPLHSTPRASVKGKGRETAISDREDDDGFVVLPPKFSDEANETLDISHLPTRLCEDAKSLSSTVALDERLLDISMPALLNQTLSSSHAPLLSTPTPAPQRPLRPRQSFEPFKTTKSPRPLKPRAEKRTYTDRGTQTIPAHPIELVHALQLTSHLEVQLEERTAALTEALKDLARAKLGAAMLGDKLRQLEKEKALVNDVRRRDDTSLTVGGNNTVDGDGGYGGYMERLEATTKERDDALGLVAEIKTLMRD